MRQGSKALQGHTRSELATGRADPRSSGSSFSSSSSSEQQLLRVIFRKSSSSDAGPAAGGRVAPVCAKQTGPAADGIDGSDPAAVHPCAAARGCWRSSRRSQRRGRPHSVRSSPMSAAASSLPPLSGILGLIGTRPRAVSTRSASLDKRRGSARRTSWGRALHKEILVMDNVWMEYRFLLLTPF